MRPLLLLAATAALAAATDYQAEFAQFKEKFGKVYPTRQEEDHRFGIFRSNVQAAEAHNAGGSSYRRGVTQFSDLTQQEFTSRHLGLQRPVTPAPATTAQTAQHSRDLPDRVDWVEAGAVTAVKNQGHCGSCWAFSLTAQVESYAFLAGAQLEEFSTQQVTSCTPNTVQCGGTGGCKGSVTQLGYNYLQLFGGVRAADWPYTSGETGEGGECGYDLELLPPVVGLAGYNSLPPNDEQAVMKHIAEVGPLSIAVDASAWHSYESGVFTGCDFNENISINHGVQLVGYGSDFSPLGVYDYWLVRNSWGEAWGEGGYIKLLRTAECGTNNSPMDGTACVGGPGTDTQRVCGMCGMLLDTTFPLGVHRLD